jgi:hypothetical protein
MNICFVCHTKDSLRQLDSDIEWEITSEDICKIFNLDSFYKIDGRVCKKCEKTICSFIYSCCEKNCDNSWDKKKSVLSILESNEYWTSLPTDISDMILSYVNVPFKQNNHACEFCNRRFCNEHDRTFDRYYYNEYVRTCPECYQSSQNNQSSFTRVNSNSFFI